MIKPGLRRMAQDNAEVNPLELRIYEAEALLIATLELQASLLNAGLPTQQAAKFVQRLDAFIARCEKFAARRDYGIDANLRAMVPRVERRTRGTSLL